MATGRIGVTPTLGTRWSKAPSAGTTSLSGLDDNSVSLVYSVGYEQVYRNGVLLSRGNDYTATSGNSITLTDATVNGDIIEVFANELVPLTDAISKGQFTAKGALLSASAASTPAVLAVGTNNQVLTADSSTTTGLKWAAASSGGMTLLETLTLSGSSTTSSTISGSYKEIRCVFKNVYAASNENGYIRLNSDSGNNYAYSFITLTGTSPAYQTSTGGNLIWFADLGTSTGALQKSSGIIDIPRYTDTDQVYVNINSISQLAGTQRGHWLNGLYDCSAAITSITFLAGGSTFSAGTVYIYGVS